MSFAASVGGRQSPRRTRAPMNGSGGMGPSSYAVNTSPQRAASSGVDDGSDAIARSIRQLEQDLTRLRTLVGRLGGHEDGPQLRSEVAVHMKRVHQECSQTEKAIKTCAPPRGSDHNTKIAFKKKKEKLARDFLLLFRDFEAIDRMAKQKFRESSGAVQARGRKAAAAPESQSSRLLDEDEQQRRQLMQQQMEQADFQSALLDERHESIMAITSEMGQVQEIFRDLAEIVSDQGAVIDDLEANIVTTLTQVKDGASNVDKAHELQKKARTKQCMVLVLVVLVIGVVGLFAFGLIS